MEKTRFKPKEVLPYGMLLTRLFKHVVSVSPELAFDRYLSHDRAMHPLALHYERKTRADHGKKRPQWRDRRHHDRRYAARGNGNEHRDPHDIAEIERLQERIRELELNQFNRYEGSTTDSVVREHTHDGFHNNFARRHPNCEPATDPLRTLGIRTDLPEFD
ncbi:hypothetical protein Tco_0167276 [Tanacetum coccineum]